MNTRLYPHVKNLRHLFGREAFMLVIMFAAWKFYVTDEMIMPFLGFVFFALTVEWIPAGCLTYKYYRQNRNQVFIVAPESLTVAQDGHQVRYSTASINKIVVRISRSNPRFAVAFHSIDLFHYAKIYVNEGSSVVITSICSDRVGEILEDSWPEIPIEYKWGILGLGKIGDSDRAHKII